MQLIDAAIAHISDALKAPESNGNRENQYQYILIQYCKPPQNKYNNRLFCYWNFDANVSQAKSTVTAIDRDQDVSESDRLLSLCKASADSLRLDIMRVLSKESFGVLELCRIFDMPQPGMSHHLKLLATAGLVTTKREGNSIFYRRSLPSSKNTLENLTRSMFDAIDQIALDSQRRTSVAAVHDDRALSAKQFFDKNAHRLKENQDLIVEFKHYSGCLQDLLFNEVLATNANVIEVGPGESELINLLINKFERVTAIDTSEEMLLKAQARLSKEQGKKVEFLLGDLSGIQSNKSPADLIVLNMVLHHLPSPQAFFKTAQQHLSVGGQLLIVDLCSHNQDWAREVCGDLWLGFEPDELTLWAHEASLKVGQSVYLGLKNGFQVQLRLFQN
ncbi:MAG: metalloregulator ArsR/SmtB family transcription factor [Pseudomonadales bacterium]